VKSPDQKPLFYKSINTSGIVQNASAVSNAMIEVLETLGPEKFSCVITDNAPVMRAARKLIEEKYPNICANGCAAHAVNLLIKDIVNVPETAKTIKEAEKVIKFIKNHHLIKAKFEERRIATNIQRTLSMPVSTRWLSLYNSTNDLLASKYVLIQFVDEESDLIKDIQPKSNSIAITTMIKSDAFWNRLAKVVNEIEYPTKIIRKLESDEASLSLVYHYFTEMFQAFEGDENVQKLIKNRLDFIYSDSIGLSYILDPKYAATGYYFDEDKTDIISSSFDLALRVNPKLPT
jgi:hypothetical protein